MDARHATPPRSDAAGSEDVGPRLVVARGARAAEAWLLGALRAEVEATRDDPSRLARPLRIVVPSRSLREHVACAIARELGSVLGVQVQTLHGLACEILERAGAELPPGDALYPVLVRRAAAAEPALASVLDQLDDGYASVLGGVSDFLDAGLDDASGAGVAECVAAQAGAGASGDETLRALAIVAVAGRVRRELSERGRRRRSDRVAAAAQVLRDTGAPALPSRAVWVHGFVDATGVALDLIDALARNLGAALLLDLPPDPAREAEGGASARFARRFGERAALAGAGAACDAGVLVPPPSLALLEAVGADAEVRGIAARVRALLDGTAGAGPPCAPEHIGIVARQLDPYTTPLRRHLRRLGIPFSASAAGPGGALARRLGAIVELLRRGAAASIDRWLDARRLAPGLRADLRVALHLLGAGRLGDVARLDADAVLGEEAGLGLEVPLGFADGEDDDEDEGQPDEAPVAVPARARAYTRKRWLPRARIEDAIAAARALVAALETQREAPVAEHAARLRSGISPLLGTGSDPAARGAAAAGSALERALGVLETALPADEPLEPDAWVRCVERALADEVAEPLGGAGAGVQVLDVTAARARTFDHLFVLGLNRDVFPRSVPGDPLLPDSLRGAVRAVLPDLPVKESGYDEERHLFAQLLSASPRVTLSWQAAGDDGKPRSPSPLVERLRWCDAALAPEILPGLHARPGAGPGPGPMPMPRPAHEHAVLAALHGGEAAFARVWPVAVSEAATGPPGGGARPADLAAAQLAIARELDRYGAPDEPLGPYLGFVGPVVDAGDPRRRDLYVTTAESIARCGWKHFLGRILGVAPAPDALGALAGVDGSLVGQAVHRAVEQIAERAGCGRGVLADALAGDGVAPRWPDDAGLASLALAASETVLREEMRFPLPGLARATAAKVEHCLRLLREADAQGERRLLGVELPGACTLAGADAPLLLHFRADRAERVDGELVLTDVKTGSAVWTTVAKTEDTRAEHHLAALRRGTHLQAAVYAVAAAATSGERARGRYLFALPGADEPAVYDVRSDDDRFTEALAAVAGVVVAARQAGSFLPRVVDVAGAEPRGCGWCELAEACVRGDSGLRGRLRRWALAREKGPHRGDTEAERRLRDLWWLGGEEGE